MRKPISLSLSPDTVRAVDELVEAGDFRGTALRRRSRSDVADVLLQYAIGRYPAWQQQRLKCRDEGDLLTWTNRHQQPVKKKEEGNE